MSASREDGALLKNHERRVELYCLTCGSGTFRYESLDSGEYSEDHIFTCACCGRSFRKAELIEGNADVISANVDEIVEEVASDLQKELNAMLKKVWK